MEWMRLGGVMMWPLLACSIVNLAIVIERAWVLGARRAPARISATTDKATVMKLLDTRSDFAPFAQELERSRIDEASVQACGQNIVMDMQRHLTLLDTLTKSATLMGLLGTILGMISAFGVIASSSGAVDMAQLAQGLWQAMITTAAGLMIAIPSGIALAWFRSQVRQTAHFLTMAAHSVVHARTQDA